MAKTKEEMKEYNRNWRKLHPDYGRQYYLDNREVILARVSNNYKKPNNYKKKDLELRKKHDVKKALWKSANTKNPSKLSIIFAWICLICLVFIFIKSCTQ